MPRKNSSRSGTEERRKAILSAALQCFNEHGIENTTVQDIQLIAKCSTGSLYHHFGSKEGIAACLFIETFKSMNAGVLAELQQCDDARSGVHVLVTQICQWVSGNTSAARFLLQSRDIQLSPDRQAELKHNYVEIMRAYFRWFTPFVEDGSMKSLPLDTYVPLISGPVQEYARRWLARQVDQSPASLNGVFSDAAWNAVRMMAPCEGVANPAPCAAFSLPGPFELRSINRMPMGPALMVNFTRSPRLVKTTPTGSSGL